MASIIVQYKGGHNFEIDTNLEEIAERPRADSSMDFEAEIRTISFDFDEEADAEKFATIVQSAYPDLSISAV